MFQSYHREYSPPNNLQRTDSQDNITKNCPPTQPPRFVNDNSYTFFRYVREVPAAGRFHPKRIISGWDFGIGSFLLVFHKMPVFIIPLQSIRIRYLILRPIDTER